MPQSPPKILIYSKPAIGDALLATPLIHAIREQEPEAVIDLLVAAGQEGIVEGNPDISDVITLPARPRIGELARTFRRLWRHYDIGICNAVDDRGHLYLWALARKRVAVHVRQTEAWKRWVTWDAFFEGDEGTHALLRNNALGGLLGFRSSYSVVPPRVDDDRGRSTVLDNIVKSGRPYAVLHLEARLPYKRWTNAGWKDVATHLASQGLDVYLTGGGGNEENQYLASVLKSLPASAASLSGKLRLAETSELIAHCHVYIGIDTVNSHIAAAHGVPTVAIFGPESPHRWGPWPAGIESETSPWVASGSQQQGNVSIVQSEAACATCRPGDCRKRANGGSNCTLMTSITSDQVILATRALLDGSTG